eukprot:scaffold2165_cov289-Prasinococcus_capsulatus_cf.AAC.3
MLGRVRLPRSRCLRGLSAAVLVAVLAAVAMLIAAASIDRPVQASEGTKVRARGAQLGAAAADAHRARGVSGRVLANVRAWGAGGSRCAAWWKTRR